MTSIRFTFAGGPGDFVITSPSTTADVVHAYPNATGTAWSQSAGGTQYTDLLAIGATPPPVATDANGFIYPFQGPLGVGVLWVDFGAGQRFPLIARELVNVMGPDGHLLDASLPSTAQAATLAATYVSKSALGVVSLNDPQWGADPTGATDSTAAIEAAYAALPASGGYMSGLGTFLVSTLSAWSKLVVVAGHGRFATTFKTTAATGDVFTLTANGSGFHQVGFDSTVTRTSGAYVKASSMRYGSTGDVHLSKYFIGLDLDGVVGYDLSSISALSGTASSVAAGGGVLRLGATAYTGGINVRGITADVSVSTAQPSYGISLGYVDVVTISGALVIHHGDDLSITPGTGQNAAHIKVIDCTFDTAGRGMHVAPTGGASVTRSKFTNSWFGAASIDGVTIEATLPSTVSGLSFVNDELHANAVNGATITGSGVSGVYIADSFGASNGGDAVHVAGGAQNVHVSGGALGPISGLAGNTGYAVSVAAGCTGWVRGVLLTGNTAGTINNLAAGFDSDTPQTAVGVVTATSGTITTASGSTIFTVLGGLVEFETTVSITTNGTGAGAVQVTLPFNSAAMNVHLGRETALTGGSLQALTSAGSNVLQIRKIDGATYPGGDGANLVVSGTYRRA